MSEIPKRAADAIRSMAWGGQEPPNTFDDADAIVRVIAQALREPTRAMVEAGDDAIDRGPYGGSDEAWPAMIDAALKEVETPATN